MQNTFHISNADNPNETITVDATTKQSAIWKYFAKYPERETDARTGEPLNLVITDNSYVRPVVSHATFRPVIFADVVTPGGDAYFTGSSFEPVDVEHSFPV